MKPFYVNIITSDQGWILEKLANAIIARLNYTRYGEVPDSKALINYYITYSCWNQKVSPVALALFTHCETDPNAQTKFFQTAHEVDYCVCMSAMYENILRKDGVRNVVTIYPGVALDRFRPKLQIGVVGRTYASGRKGEALVAALQDIDWIDWYFTGDGWPGKALHLPAEEMPGFYSKMDYILVPALYEGGPMCVIEALACGTEVIAPPIGWVPDFPHIEYKTGDEADLRRVLRDLYEAKLQKSESVAHLTWDAWAQKHDQLFRKLAAELGYATTAAVVGSAKVEIALVSQANENASKGGPSVRVPKTVKLLRQWTKYKPMETRLGDPFPDNAKLIHAFNSIKNSSDAALASASKRHIPAVLSPIFLDPMYAVIAPRLKQLFCEFYSDEDFNRRFAELMQECAQMECKAISDSEYERMQTLLDQTAHLICLSRNEEKLLKKYGFTLPPLSIVHNPIDPAPFRGADPNLFRKKYGLDDYVLCVGRIDWRKNQHLLAYALKDTGLPVVFAGHATRPDDLPLLQKHGGKNMVIVGRLEPNSAILASAYAGARVYCLPSWAEGASLANLEAAVSGCNMVLSSRSSEREYFGDYARYCDPASIDSIRDTVLDAWNNPISDEKKAALRNYVEENCSWEKHIDATAAVYDQTLAAMELRKEPVSPAFPVLYIDLTWSAYHAFMSGFSRVELNLSRELAEVWEGEIRHVIWDDKDRTFVEIDFTNFVAGKPSLVSPKENIRRPSAVFQKNSILLTVGSHWLLNVNYVRDLGIAAREAYLVFVPYIFDIIYEKLPQFSIPRDKTMTQNLRRVFKEASIVLTSSASTANDVQEAFAKELLPVPLIKKTRMGDYVLDGPQSTSTPVLPEILRCIGERKFVLCISSLDLRKNHRLLFNVWERLLAKYGSAQTPHLLCIGYGGRGESEIIELRNKTPNLNMRVQFFRDLTNRELEWLYRNCLFTVYPSLYEGWGLPVGEALAHGKICIASNASSIPEIAPQFTDLLDPLDFRAWYEKIEDYIFNPQMRKAREGEISSYVPTTWRDVANNVSEILQTHEQGEPDWEILLYGDIIRDFRTCPANRILGDGWNDPAPDGVRMASDTADLLFGLRMRGEAALLSLNVRYVMPALVAVHVNSHLLQTIDLANVPGKELRLYIPHDLADARGVRRLRVTFQLKKKESGCPADPGSVGFTLQSFSISQASPADYACEQVLQWLAESSPELASLMRTLLLARPDLHKMLDRPFTQACNEVLLWMWVFSKKEAPEIYRHIDAVKDILRKHYMTRAENAHINGYTQLIDHLWQIRPDLHIMDTTTPEGQGDMVIWFHQHGIDEYGLHRILKNE